jgi:hypothetical protein
VAWIVAAASEAASSFLTQPWTDQPVFAAQAKLRITEVVIESFNISIRDVEHPTC